MKRKFGQFMNWLDVVIYNYPLIISLALIGFGFYFGENALWGTVTISLCLLLYTDPDKIVVLVVYAFSFFLMHRGYRKIRQGLEVEPPSAPRASSTPVTNLAIDGNNLLGLAKWDLITLKRFTDELRQDGFTLHLFFDHSVYRTLKENDLLQPNETVPMAVSRLLDVDRHMLTVSKKGHKADALLIRFADRNDYMVLSNDRFNKTSEDFLYQKAVSRLGRKGFLKRVGLLQGELTIL